MLIQGCRQTSTIDITFQGARGSALHTLEPYPIDQKLGKCQAYRAPMERREGRSDNRIEMVGPASLSPAR